MRFTPKSEKEIQEERFPVLKPGKYHFEVTDAKEDVSKKSGKAMLVLSLKIMDNSFNTIASIKDYLMESMPYKIRHAAYGCGLGSEYETGEIHSDQFIGRAGMVDLVIQKDKSGQYPDKNSVNDYIKDEQPKSRSEGSADWEDMPEPPDWLK